ncbi:hypothetical protein Tco_0459593 [Tanacetum coccineum]
MTWHATEKCMEPGKMQHPVNGRAWKDFDTKYPDFAAEPRNSSFMLTLLIPGLKSLGKDIDVYLRSLIDDLKDLWAKPGVETIDVATGLKFNMRAMVLWTINDFPARSSLSRWSGQGYRACPTCNEDTPYVRVLDKTTYAGHRRFLKKEVTKKFCQFIKGVKLPDGFGSKFKHKVTNNDSNITSLKSHDCHIVMQHLLPYILQQYLPSSIATPIIELCSFFKQICSQNLMDGDMLKAQRKVIDILYNLELIYPPAFFDNMIHLVIHLPLEAIFGRPIHPRWMYPFKRYMKKLKNYVQNKAKPEGSIVEGYVAEEALAFSSHYFRDVTTKFNRPDHNVDFPPPTCQFQVFKSLCKSIGLRSVIRIDHQELKKVIWYVLHNSPKIDTYRAKFKIEFPNKDMKEEFLEDDPDVIYVDNSSDLALSTSLNDLEIAALHIDGQSKDVDAPPDIVDVVDEDDDIIDEEDPIPHDLADSDDEDLVNLDIDDGGSWTVTVAGDDVPFTFHIPTGWGRLLGNREFDVRSPHGIDSPGPTLSMRPSSSIYKRSTMARSLLLRKGIGFLTRTRLTTWSASDYHVLRTFLRLIGCEKFGVLELDPRTDDGKAQSFTSTHLMDTLLCKSFKLKIMSERIVLTRRGEHVHEVVAEGKWRAAGIDEQGDDEDDARTERMRLNQAQKQRRRTYRAHGRINRYRKANGFVDVSSCRENDTNTNGHVVNAGSGKQARQELHFVKYLFLERCFVYLARLGAEVTVVEFAPDIVPSMDGEVRKQFQRTFQKQHMKFMLKTKVVSVDTSTDIVKLTLEPSAGGDQTVLEADVVLISAGRNPFTSGLGLETIGVETNKIGRIHVDGRFSTKVKGVFAIGDVIPGPMLAHKAEEDGIACVEFIIVKEGHVDYDKIPGLCYTHPKVAYVGKTEEQVKDIGIAYRVGTFPMLGNSRAKSIDDAEGLVKIIVEKETDKVLGVHIMCSNAGELIYEAALALTCGTSTCDDGVVRVFKLDDASSKSFKFMRIKMPGGRPTAVALAHDDVSIVVAAQSLIGASLYM